MTYGGNGAFIDDGEYQALENPMILFCQGGLSSSSSCRNHAGTISWKVHGQKLPGALDLLG